MNSLAVFDKHLIHSSLVSFKTHKKEINTRIVHKMCLMSSIQTTLGKRHDDTSRL